MPPYKVKKRAVISTLFLLLALPFCFLGCVRLTGGAGVWKQGSEDEAPVVHQAGFDTADIVPQSRKTV